jgi:hypothetical protein
MLKTISTVKDKIQRACINGTKLDPTAFRQTQTGVQVASGIRGQVRASALD